MEGATLGDLLADPHEVVCSHGVPIELDDLFGGCGDQDAIISGTRPCITPATVP